MTKKNRSLFPYPGGKKLIADVAWKGLDPNSKNFYITCAGSLALLLARPIVSNQHLEIANDPDCMLMNLWRTLRSGDIELFAEMCQRPDQELDILASHRQLIAARDELTELMLDDLDYYYLPYAVHYLRGLHNWIGFGFSDPAQANNKVKFPEPEIKIWRRDDFIELLLNLKKRLQNVVMYCGGWERLFSSKTKLELKKDVAIFIDPPYIRRDRSKMYVFDDGAVAYQTRQWAILNGVNPQLRIVYCGYYRHHAKFFEAAGWTCYRWKATGGYGNQGNGQGRINARDEAIFFSPHCRPLD